MTKVRVYSPKRLLLSPVCWAVGHRPGMLWPMVRNPRVPETEPVMFGCRRCSVPITLKSWRVTTVYDGKVVRQRVVASEDRADRIAGREALKCGLRALFRERPWRVSVSQH